MGVRVWVGGGGGGREVASLAMSFSGTPASARAFCLLSMC